MQVYEHFTNKYKNLLSYSRKHVRYLRLLILQLPIVQGLVYMVLLVMWAEEEVKFKQVY
jgi:organic solute transporter subunit alpha